jgi:hypothetical protein
MMLERRYFLYVDVKKPDGRVEDVDDRGWYPSAPPSLLSESRFGESGKDPPDVLTDPPSTLVTG